MDINAAVEEGTPRQHKDMPDSMIKREFFGCIKNGPYGVGQAASQHPEHNRGLQNLFEVPDEEYDQPTHGKIDKSMQYLQSAPENQFEYSSQNNNRPYKNQKPVSLFLRQNHTEGRIGSGNKNIDINMIQDTEDAFPVRRFYQMIDRGRGIAENH